MFQAQSIGAAWPFLLGIFSGHIFHFFTNVWPKLGGRAWLDPPRWFVKKFGDKPKSNVPGLKVGPTEDTKKKPVKFGKAHKLGSSVKIN